ncbi:MAG TPA: hypothetical protein VEM96_07075 [Pyrinomonadaceae bacterium]|nr:hypothetical protein [Pyrinomonadaceae bacterium]
MPENEKTNNDPGKADKKDDRTSHAGLWWICIAGGVLLATLLFLSIFLPSLTERVKFFTLNALSLLVLTVIAVQAYIYRRQWEVIERQESVMRESLVETRNLVVQNERAVKAAEDNAKTAQEALSAGERAYLVIEDMQLTPTHVGDNWAVTITLFNGGRTPSWGLECAGQAVIASEMPDDIPRLERFDKREVIIPAGTRKQIEVVFEKPVTDEDRKAINGGTITFFALGEIRYRDFQRQLWRLPYDASFDHQRRRFKDRLSDTYIEPAQ